MEVPTIVSRRLLEDYGPCHSSCYAQATQEGGRRDIAIHWRKEEGDI
jgi:hypothetical protein